MAQKSLTIFTFGACGISALQRKIARLLDTPVKNIELRVPSPRLGASTRL